MADISKVKGRDNAILLKSGNGMTTDNVDKVKVDKEKVPFDKKKYRLKKYSNKYKIQQWENNRKQKILRKFYKEIADDSPPGTFKPFLLDENVKEEKAENKMQDDINKEENMDDVDGEVGKFVKHPSLMKMSNQLDKTLANKNKAKNNAFWKAKQEFRKIQADKLNMIKKNAIAKEEKKAALEKYKYKKTENFKKLNRKTKRGQPVMTGRLELLLDKIQNSK